MGLPSAFHDTMTLGCALSGVPWYLVNYSARHTKHCWASNSWIRLLCSKRHPQALDLRKGTDVVSAYQRMVADGIVHWDEAQLLVLEALGALQASLETPQPASTPDGMYIYGGPGSGKSLIMDTFVSCTDVPSRRTHLSEFMLDVHQRVHQLTKATGSVQDPVTLIATELAQELKLLSLDEFQISDIADAALIVRLMKGLWANGVVTVATSNRAPADLYKGGLNRHHYIPPFVKMMNQHCNVLTLDHGTDYRKLHASDTSEAVYRVSQSSRSSALPAVFKRQTGTCVDKASEDTVQVMMGRQLLIPRLASGVSYFHFDQLCGASLGAADYISLAQRCHTVMLEGVPQLGLSTPDWSRRFQTLVDILYDHHRLLICEAAVPIEQLFGPSYIAPEGLRSEDRLARLGNTEG